MEIVLLQFFLMALNLYGAKWQKNKNRNSDLNYFVAGMTFGLGTYKLITIIFI